jgi:hypothetical protein
MFRPLTDDLGVFETDKQTDVAVRSDDDEGSHVWVDAIVFVSVAVSVVTTRRRQRRYRMLCNKETPNLAPRQHGNEYCFPASPRYPNLPLLGLKLAPNCAKSTSTLGLASTVKTSTTLSLSFPAGVYRNCGEQAESVSRKVASELSQTLSVG